ncbi:hypothetical protein [Kocuria nitroreducens]|uniref:hypothetical protein n=1 Tax=Kocuria nitroreducens TaxID=3058914 RepID=UPI0036DCD6C9
METTTDAPAENAIPDAVAAEPATGHAPDSLAVHAVQPALSTLEKPVTIAEVVSATDEDGFLTAVVVDFLFDLLEGRANEESGEDYPIVREMVEEELEPVQTGDEAIGASPTDMLTPVARFDLREALGFRYGPEELEGMIGSAA